jgi:hypothetical protein
MNDDGVEHKKYKVRLLRAILDNIVTKDSTNVKLGLLMVASNVGAARHERTSAI